MHDKIMDSVSKTMKAGFVTGRWTSGITLYGCSEIRVKNHPSYDFCDVMWSAEAGAAASLPRDGRWKLYHSKG